MLTRITACINSTVEVIPPNIDMTPYRHRSLTSSVKSEWVKSKFENGGLILVGKYRKMPTAF
jgi:hypothetical protein